MEDILEMPITRLQPLFHFKYHISFTATKMNLIVSWHPYCITNNAVPVRAHKCWWPVQSFRLDSMLRCLKH